MQVTFIGFGEAGQAFASAPDWRAAAAAFDILTDAPERRAAKHDDYRRCGVAAADRLADAVAGSPLVLSLVTADQALTAASAAAGLLLPGTLYCDLNSVAPDTKRAAAAAVEGRGGRYVDVAIMAPVLPGRLAAPLLVSGRHAAAAVAALAALGFADVRAVGDEVGSAAAVKMIRSVVVKGIEALTAECLLAAARAGVVDEVLASLGGDWARRADYNLDRMLVHGVRRAAEMEQAATTLHALGVTPSMTRGTIDRQNELGALDLGSIAGLEAKLTALTRALPAARAA